MKIVIVGGVAGGATAAARLRRLDEKAQIVVLERTGYVLTRYLDFYEPQVWEAELRVYNCKKSITLRSAPSTSAEEICQIPLGAEVAKLYWQPDSSFYLVSYNGMTGYALKSYLR